MFDQSTIKKFENTPTPFYYYNLALLKKTLSRIKKSADKYGFVVHYALKANANPRILEIIRQAGFGADCVSGNEVKQAIESGFRTDQIVFAGVGKTDREINYAIGKKIFCFNCESLQEIEVIDELARKNQLPRNGKKNFVPVALRINPDINPKTHHYITTGLEENKFGISRKDLEAAVDIVKKSDSLRLIGIHFHIGSQISDLNAFKRLCIKSNEIQNWLSGRNIVVRHINVGGGLGIDYHRPEDNSFPDFDTYFRIFHDFLELRPGQKLHFELGRSVVAQSGTLIARALFVKKGIETNFLILDAGMTELIRPALYQAFHKIENLSSNAAGKKSSQRKPDSQIRKYDVVGPICESSDCFGKAVLLPETKRGDLIAIRSAGAYGEVMSSTYNLREKVKAVYSEK